MRVRPLGFALLVALGCAGGARSPETPPPSPDPATRRTLGAGEVVGFADRYESFAWRGIPFAAPPLGERRWRAPAPPEPWTGVREALSSGAPCPQYATPLASVDAPAGTVVGSEDCLTLNVWTPRFEPHEVPAGSARLPVMVWIHGGGNTVGHGGYYHGGNLASTHRLVVVAVNYRLGALGWFRHPALLAASENDDDRSGNFGTLDLVRALAWVRDEISAFGGDPGNVTIFGESAGGSNVVTLLVSPRARGLFHRAIVQSGGTGTSTLAEASNPRDAAEPGRASSAYEVALDLLVRAGRAVDRQTARSVAHSMAPEALGAFLRSRTPEQVLGAYDVGGLALYDVPTLIRDGAVLPAEPIPDLLAREDGWAGVPAIFGTNRDETRFFQFLDPGLVRRWLWLFPRARDSERYRLDSEYGSRMWKATGADEPAAAIAAQGRRVWVYRFDWDEEPRFFVTDLSELLGAAHGFEIPFVFGHFELGRSGGRIFTEENAPGREALARTIMSYWAEFAYTGDPGNGRNVKQPRWTPWDPSSPTAPKFAVLDTPAGGGVRLSSEIATRDSVVAALESDARLPDWEAKCRVLGSLVRYGRSVTPERYASVGNGACGAFPLEEAVAAD
jgi:para-nitrobenzyl esterase